MSIRRPDHAPALPPSGRSWPLPLITVPGGTHLYRICRLIHPDPAYFGRGPRAHFDAPDASFGVCYLGTSLACAVLETLPHDSRTHSHTALSTTSAELTQRFAAVATTASTLRLAHLANNGLTRLAIDQRVTGGDDYSLAGAWSSAIHGHVAQPHGILYPSRHHNGLYCVALFDSAASLLTFRN